MGITNRNSNKTRLNLRSEKEMGMNHWVWNGMRLRKTYQVISSLCVRESDFAPLHPMNEWRYFNEIDRN